MVVVAARHLRTVRWSRSLVIIGPTAPAQRFLCLARARYSEGGWVVKAAPSAVPGEAFNIDLPTQTPSLYAGLSLLLSACSSPEIFFAQARQPHERELQSAATFLLYTTLPAYHSIFTLLILLLFFILFLFFYFLFFSPS